MEKNFRVKVKLQQAEMFNCRDQQLYYAVISHQNCKFKTGTYRMHRKRIVFENIQPFIIEYAHDEHISQGETLMRVTISSVNSDKTVEANISEQTVRYFIQKSKEKYEKNGDSRVLSYSLYGRNAVIQGEIKILLSILTQKQLSLAGSQYSISGSRFAKQRKVFSSQAPFRTFFTPVVSAPFYVRQVQDDRSQHDSRQSESLHKQKQPQKFKAQEQQQPSFEQIPEWINPLFKKITEIKQKYASLEKIQSEEEDSDDNSASKQSQSFYSISSASELEQGMDPLKDAHQLMKQLDVRSFGKGIQRIDSEERS